MSDPRPHEPDLASWELVPAGWRVADVAALQTARTNALSTLRVSTAGPTIARLIEYYDPDGDSIGATLSESAPNDWHDITAADLHAVSLFGRRIGPQAARRLLVAPERTWVVESLRRIPDKGLGLADPQTLERMSEFHTAVEHALAPESRPVRSTFASALAARKRPGLFPVLDTVVYERLGLTGIPDVQAGWLLFRTLIQDPDIHHGLRQLEDALTDGGVRHFENSHLRLLDAALRIVT